MKTRYEAEKETKQMKDMRKFQQSSKSFNKTWPVEYSGHKGIATHRDPATGNLYCEFEDSTAEKSIDGWYPEDSLSL